MNEGFKNLKKTRTALIEILKENGVVISTKEIAAGTVIVLTDEKTMDNLTWDGGIRNV